MILFPAIDLRAGRCVRLLKGEASTEEVFNSDPVAQMRDYADAGCRWVHVVDLDGAFGAQSDNANLIRDMLAATDLEVQLGGGIRNLEGIAAWLERGVARVILGTAAVENPQLVRKAAKQYPGRIAVGIDARNGKAATHGWVKNSDAPVADLARSYEDCGIASIIYTDIDRDGVKVGPNIEATAQLANAVSIPVIASGGVSSIADLRTLANCAADIAGAIVGRALYDGSIRLEDALEAVA